MNSENIEKRLREIALQYPGELRDYECSDIPRITFHIHLSLGERDPEDLTLCDIGGGICMFTPGCGAMGFKEVILVDDFQDDINRRLGDSIFAIHRRYGVQIITRDVITSGLGGIFKKGVDVFTCFDSMEHWHHSPKKLFHEMMQFLKPGGTFILGVPNCVNLRKRITVPLGMGKWTSMTEWYDAEIFRGHIREPDVDDLRYIARDMGLGQYKIYGRNWLGYRSSNKLIRMLTRMADYPLRRRPSLCSDIYLVGVKSNNTPQRMY